jgi:hypothetical protein
VKVGGHPMESVNHGLWKEKWGGVPSFIKEQKSANLSLKIFLVWKIVRTLLPVVDKNNHLSKQIFVSILQMKSSSTCLITASLCEGAFFYFYVESPPSTFMHRLREHSCYSEFNVHSEGIRRLLLAIRSDPTPQVATPPRDAHVQRTNDSAFPVQRDMVEW